MTDEKTDVDYFVLLEGISSCCEEGFRQGVHFMQTKVIPHKVATAERLAKSEVLEEVLHLMDKLRSFSPCDYKDAKNRIEVMLNELKATK